MADESAVVCPYCGMEISPHAVRCSHCTGRLDEFSRRVTQQHLGPWYIRLPRMAHRPGCSYSVLRDMVRRGTIEADTIIRGPTTRQYWMYAKDTPGVAHLLGVCHACGQWVETNLRSCPYCSVEFPRPEHRNYLGLDPDNYRLVTEAVRRERGESTSQQAAGPDAEADGGFDRLAAETTAAGGARSGERTAPRPMPRAGSGSAAPHGGGGGTGGGAGKAGAAAAPQRQPQDDPEQMFGELAEAASTHERQAPVLDEIPRKKKRLRGKMVWSLIGINAFLILLVLVLVVLHLLTGGGAGEGAGGAGEGAEEGASLSTLPAVAAAVRRGHAGES